jgi:hypothetical protein
MFRISFGENLVELANDTGDSQNLAKERSR